MRRLMEVILYLFWLAYGGDVVRLGDSDFAVRDAAHKRLAKAGSAAMPALLAGYRSACPERRHRLDILVGRQMTAAEWVSRAVLRCPGLPDEVVNSVGVWAAKDDGLARVLYPMVDRSGDFWSTNSRAWAESLPYVTGTREKEYGHVLLSVRRKALDLPMPKLVDGK